MRSPAWTVLTLAALACMAWGSRSLWAPPRTPGPGGRLDAFEKEALFRLPELARSPGPEAAAFLGELKADPILSAALQRGGGFGPAELARFQAVLSRHSDGVRAALARPAPAAQEKPCGPGAAPPGPASPLGPAPDSACPAAPAPGTLALPASP